MTRQEILVTGGAGFLGSNLTRLLLAAGHKVTVLDALWTGSHSALADFTGNANFDFVEHDVVNPFPTTLPRPDRIYHLACPGSPKQFPEFPIRILETCFRGTQNALDFGLKHKARVLLASTSEIYGDALVCPQPESYWGNVNSFGPRACYDEGKRVAEALAYGYRLEHQCEVRVARIFNAYGPGLPPADGRATSNFISAAINGEPIVIYGDGQASRCFQYVDDCVRGLIMLMESNVTGPVNIGGEREVSIFSLATMVRDLVSANTRMPPVELKFVEKVVDEPVRRVPDASRARELLGWVPEVPMTEGLERAYKWYKEVIHKQHENGKSAT